MAPADEKGEKIPVFHPTMEEMKDFPAYINYIESQNAHKIGLAKIIPPLDYVPRKSGYDNVNLTIPTPIQQFVDPVAGQVGGVYQVQNEETRARTVKEFALLAESDKYSPPVYKDVSHLSGKFWKNVHMNAPIYGADFSGTLYDDDQDIFNIGRLGTILDSTVNDVKIDGVNTPYLYFGMWKSFFPWHTEDMDLYSINYLHYGAPKTWYSIPPKDARRFEQYAAGLFHEAARKCPRFLRHKTSLISPLKLRQGCIPFEMATQYEGEFMITFPMSYHAGFNHGYNCAESTNFASERWIEYGKRATLCECKLDNVRIKMDPFVQRYQPERYVDWMKGDDQTPHPEGDGKPFKKRKGAASKSRPDENTTSSLIPEQSAEVIPCRNSRRQPLACVSSEPVPDQTDPVQPTSTKRSWKDASHPSVDDSSDTEPPQAKRHSPSASSYQRTDLTGSDQVRTFRPSATAVSASSQGVVTFVSTRRHRVLPQVSNYNQLSSDERKQYFEEERKYNKQQGLIPPNCSVCAAIESPRMQRDYSPSNPNNARKSESEKKEEEEKREERHPQGPLLTCQSCCMRVHAKCYGVSDPNIDLQNFMCYRCASQTQAAACYLCPLRGGAHVPTSCGKWVHFVCAVHIHEATMERTECTAEKVQVVFEDVESALGKRKCIYCTDKIQARFDPLSNSSASLYGVGRQCTHPGCEAYFHVTCGMAAGVMYKIDSYNPIRITTRAICPSHLNLNALLPCSLPLAHPLPPSPPDSLPSPPSRAACSDSPSTSTAAAPPIHANLSGVMKSGGSVTKKALASTVTKPPLHPIACGQKVIAPKEGFYCPGTVMSSHLKLFYKVKFIEDKTISDDTEPEDIVKRVPRDESKLHPSVGSRVSVRWDDGEIYEATFLGTNEVYVYKLHFDNGNELDDVEQKYVFKKGQKPSADIRSQLQKQGEEKSTKKKSGTEQLKKKSGKQ